jgi:hypothetical protein
MQTVTVEEIQKLLKHNDDGYKVFHAAIGVLPKVVGDKATASNYPFRYAKAK